LGEIGGTNLSFYPFLLPRYLLPNESEKEKRPFSGYNESMSLRMSTLLIVALTLLGLASVLILAVNNTLIPYFQEDEQRSMQRSLEVLRGAYDAQLRDLENIARERSRGESAYQYLQSGSPAFAAANLTEASFTSVRVNLLAYINPDATLAASSAFSLESGEFEPVPAALTEWLSDPKRRTALLESRSGSSGLIATKDVPLLTAIQPILPASGEGPANGYLLVGRYLDTNLLQQLNLTTGLNLTLLGEGSTSQDPDYPGALNALDTSGGNTWVSPLDKDNIAGYWRLRDSSGETAYLLRNVEPRPIRQRGEAVLDYLTIALAASAFTFSVMVLLVLELLVFKRLSGMARDVKRIGSTGNINLRLPVKGRDELSGLAGMINSALEDLGQAQRIQRESDERFRTVVNALDDMVYTVDPARKDVRIYGGNPARNGLLPELLLGSQEGATPQVLDAAEQHRLANERAFAGEHVVFGWMLPAEGNDCYYQTALVPLRDDAGDVSGAAGVARDVTTEKRLESSLRSRVDELDMLYSVSQGLLREMEASSISTRIIQAAVSQLELEAAWVGVVQDNGSAIQSLSAWNIPEESLSTIPRGDNPFWRSLTSKSDLDVPMVEGTAGPAVLESRSLAILPFAAGEDREGILAAYSRGEYFSASNLRLLKSLANLMELALRNARLFEQVQKGRQQLQALSTRLVDVQEEERRLLARELHDDIAQTLTSMKMLLDIEQRLGVNEPSVRLVQVNGLLNSLITEVRRLSQDLHPGMLYDLGLIPALMSFIERFSREKDITVDFSCSEGEIPRLPAALELTGYRFVQEALSNVARHSGAKTAEVRAWVNGDVLALQVEDSGAGFDASQVLTGTTAGGLVGLRERIRLAGGYFTVESAPGRGASLTAELPLGITLEEQA
jgi:signal transduction histidine kinase/sensor domain CHASE-containing protein